jgi:hypothetical protein
MSSPDPHQGSPPPRDHAAAASHVRLPEFYADSPQAWFFCIDAMFAASRITASLTKFNYALSKLPFSLIDTIGPLCRDPSAHRDPYQELQDILLRSYGLSAAQRTGKWLDYPGCGNNRPSVMWDNLTALQPSSVKEIQTVLFLRKLPRHIRNLINPREFREPEDLIQRCNEIWEDLGCEEAAAAAAAAAATSRPISPFRDTRRSSSPFRGKGPNSDKSSRRRSPTPGPSKSGGKDRLCYYHTRFGSRAHKCEKGCTYQEN